MNNYIKDIGLPTWTKKQSAHITPYFKQNIIPRIELPAHMDMKTLGKAIYLNNSIFQAERASYEEKILFNNQGEWVYFHPATGETILSMDARFGQVCSIVYTAVRMNTNLTKIEMEIMNSRYKLLKEKME